MLGFDCARVKDNTVLLVKTKCNRRVGSPACSLRTRVIAHRLVLQMELFVDDLVECHGDVRVRAMMVPCRSRFRLRAALAFIAIL